jgi:hypothetical protein
MRPADQIGVLALPADPGCLAQRLFHHRGGVDEDLQFACRLARDQPARQRLERLFHDVVVIAPLRIDRNPRFFRRVGKRQRIDIGGVAHPQRDHAVGFGP